MNDHFADAVNAVIHEVLEFQDHLRSGRVPPLDEARSQFIRAVDGFAAKGREQPGSRLDFDLARCALVYWIDEMLILRCGWPHAEDFRAACLELHFTDLKALKERPLRHVDRAVEGPYRFFEMAEVAKTRDETDALETFLLCVAIGFRGRYEVRADVLEDWARRTHAHIAPRLRKRDEEARRSRKPTTLLGQPLCRLRGQHLLLGVSVLVAASALITLIAFIVAVHLRPY